MDTLAEKREKQAKKDRIEKQRQAHAQSNQNIRYNSKLLLIT
jgi:hypothetical protein